MFSYGPVQQVQLIMAINQCVMYIRTTTVDLIICYSTSNNVKPQPKSSVHICRVCCTCTTCFIPLMLIRITLMLIRILLRASWHIRSGWRASKNQIARSHLWGLNELSCPFCSCSVSPGRRTRTHLSPLSPLFLPNPKRYRKNEHQQSARLKIRPPSFPAAHVTQATRNPPFPVKAERQPVWFQAAQLLSFLSSCCYRPCFLLFQILSSPPWAGSVSPVLSSLSVRSVTQAALKVFVRTVWIPLLPTDAAFKPGRLRETAGYLIQVYLYQAALGHQTWACFHSLLFFYLI